MQVVIFASFESLIILQEKIRRGFVNDIEFAETLPQKNYKENQQSYEDTYDQYHTRIPALSRKR